MYGLVVRSQKEVHCVSHFLQIPCFLKISAQALFWPSQSETTNWNTVISCDGTETKHPWTLWRLGSRYKCYHWEPATLIIAQPYTDSHRAVNCEAYVRFPSLAHQGTGFIYFHLKTLWESWLFSSDYILNLEIYPRCMGMYVCMRHLVPQAVPKVLS